MKATGKLVGQGGFLRAGVTYDHPIDPANPGPWKLVSRDESFARWETEIDGMTVMKTEFLGTEQLAEENRRILNENEGKRWGDGQVFASMPMNVAFQSGWTEANKQQDIKWMNQFIRDNPQYRRFKGDM
jgi:hypothetical protein